MTALRSALAMLNRRSSGSSAAAYMAGRRQEINNKAFRHAHASSAAPLQPSAIRNVEDCRRFSTDVMEPRGTTVSGIRTWWQRTTYPIHRIKHRIRTATLQESAMARFVFLVFGLGTPTFFSVKAICEL